MPEPFEILNICVFVEERPDGTRKRRLLGLGADNNVYVWSWRQGEWNPYMDWAAADEKGLPVPYRDREG